jgi:hypothetical protein
LGFPVLISNYARYFRLAAYLLRQTRAKVGIAMGVRRLRELFEEKYYTDLDGGILEAFGRMFKHDLKLFIYPVVEGAEHRLVTAENLEVAPNLRHLYAHLLQNRYLEGLRGYQEPYLRVFARDVLAGIRRGEVGWEESVPAPVARMIRERKLFGFPG